APAGSAQTAGASLADTAAPSQTLVITPRSDDASATSSPSSSSGLSPSAVDALIALLVLILVSIIGVGTLLLLKHRRSSRSKARRHSQASKSGRRSTSSSSSSSSSSSRSSKKDGKDTVLPLYSDVVNEKAGGHHHAGIDINNASNAVTISATAGRLANSSTYYLPDSTNASGSTTAEKTADEPPPSAVPEIRITFPDDEDAHGRRVAGRVVVVRIGESGGIGLEPLDEKREIEMHARGMAGMAGMAGGAASPPVPSAMDPDPAHVADDARRAFERDGLPAYEQRGLEEVDLDSIGGLKERQDV
ncbi:hypothetical protein KEM52_004020, partial [Ascosphaera acerosa]